MNNKAIRMIFFIIIPPLWIEGILILVYPGFFKGEREENQVKGAFQYWSLRLWLKNFPQSSI